MPSPKMRFGQYTAESLAELVAIFNEDKRLERYRIPTQWVTHLTTDYRQHAGVINLGYTVERPFVLVKPKMSDQPTAELMIRCSEGNLSRDEAIGTEYMPTPAEVRAKAAEIRRQHEQMGIVRNGDFVGVALHKVVARPIVAIR